MKVTLPPDPWQKVRTHHDLPAEARLPQPPQRPARLLGAILQQRRGQLEKRQDDLKLMKERVLKARYASIAQFEKEYANLIVDYIPRAIR